MLFISEATRRRVALIRVRGKERSKDKGGKKERRKRRWIPRVSNRWPAISTKLNEAKVDSCRSQIQLKVAVIRLDNESHEPVRGKGGGQRVKRGACGYG